MGRVLSDSFLSTNGLYENLCKASQMEFPKKKKRLSPLVSLLGTQVGQECPHDRRPKWLNFGGTNFA